MAKDLFSKQAGSYAAFRPTYPPALIEYILTQVKQRDTAWDCATGNGQAASLLAPYFQQVWATDISQQQLDKASSHPKVSYLVCQAEQTPLADNSVDLTTVAQAYHWFRFDQFAQEVTRVSKPGALLAVWGYSMVEPADPRVNRLLARYYWETMGPYWDPERKYIDARYTTVPFPFAEIPSMPFQIQLRWKAEDLLGYLGTWSSLQHFKTANGFDPTVQFREQLQEIWNDQSSQLFIFPLFLRLALINK
jgi:SAM-dependent methyltransferase